MKNCIYLFIYFWSRSPLATAFVSAGEEMGYKNRDGNGEFQTGFMIAQVVKGLLEKVAFAKQSWGIWYFSKKSSFSKSVD